MSGTPRSGGAALLAAFDFPPIVGGAGGFAASWTRLRGVQLWDVATVTATSAIADLVESVMFDLLSMFVSRSTAIVRSRSLTPPPRSG